MLLGVVALVGQQLPTHPPFAPVTGAPALVAGAVFLAIGLVLYFKDKTSGRDRNDT